MANSKVFFRLEVRDVLIRGETVPILRDYECKTWWGAYVDGFYHGGC